MANTISEEKTILFYFLKYNYSTRELDKILRFNPRKSKGWKSWDILKKYYIKNNDKGKLFIYKQNQAKSIISKIIEMNLPGAIEIITVSEKPNLIKKYDNSFLLAESEQKLVNILSGETRNMVREIFLSQKKEIGICQIRNCKNNDLHTCHYKKDRPTMFIESALKNRKDLNGLFMYNIYKIFEDFLLSHKEKRSVVFLCASHHNELDKLEDKGAKSLLYSFKKRIAW